MTEKTFNLGLLCLLFPVMLLAGETVPAVPVPQVFRYWGVENREWYGGDGASSVKCEASPVVLGDGCQHCVTLPVKRFYGSTVQRRVQSRLGLMPEYATFYIAVYVDDSLEQGSALSVTVNGHFLGMVDGAMAGWRICAFPVPCRWLEFPSRAGENSDNRFVFKRTGGSAAETVALQWYALILEAPGTVWLLPDRTVGQDENTLSITASILENQLGLACNVLRSRADDDEGLKAEVAALYKAMGAPGTLFASGVAGVHARRLLESDESSALTALLQAGTPNGGTPQAELQETSDGQSEQGKLSREKADAFNRRCHAPRIQIYTAGGQIEQETTDEFHRIMTEFCDVSAWDGFTEVEGLHLLDSAVPGAAPLPNGKEWNGHHDDLLRHGAPRLLAAFGDVLSAPVRSAVFGISVPKCFPGGDGAWGEAENSGTFSQRREMLSLVTDNRGAAQGGFHIFTAGDCTALLTGASKNTVCRIVSPDGMIVPVLAPSQESRSCGDLRVARFYGLPGKWRLEVTGAPPEHSLAMCVAEKEDAVILDAWQEQDGAKERKQLEIRAFGQVTGRIVSGEDLEMTATLRQIGNDSCAELEFKMKDDGDDGDATAGDGIYTAVCDALPPGIYRCRVVMRGILDGMPFRRSHVLRCGVYPALPSLRVDEHSVDESGIQIGVAAAGLLPGRYALQGDLLDTDGSRLAHAAVEFESSAETEEILTLIFPAEILLQQDLTGEVTIGNICLSWLPDEVEDALRIAHLPAGDTIDLGDEPPFAPVECEVLALSSSTNCEMRRDDAGIQQQITVDILMTLARGMTGNWNAAAVLYDPCGHPVCFSEPVPIRIAQDDRQLCFEACFYFDGTRFRGNGDNGYWSIGGIYLLRADAMSEARLVRGEFMLPPFPLPGLSPDGEDIDCGTALLHHFDRNGDMVLSSDEKLLAWRKWCDGMIDDAALLEVLALSAEEEYRYIPEMRHFANIDMDTETGETQ